jgi:pheromone alpha factor receptor
VLFVSFQVSERFAIETGSLVYTSIIVVLPLGTLLAQRLSDPTAFNGEGRSGAGNSGGNAPGWNQDANNSNVLFAGRTNSDGNQGRTGVMSSISSERRAQKEGPDALDLELARIDGDDLDLEAGRVRVNRELQQSEEKL